MFPSTRGRHYLQYLYTCSNESSSHNTDYLDDLLAETILQCTCAETSRPLNIPEPLCSGYERSGYERSGYERSGYEHSGYERPDKDSAVTRH